MSEVRFAVQSLAEDAELCWRDLQRRGLERNIAELAVLGYTVVTPEQVAGGEDVTIARDELIALADRILVMFNGLIMGELPGDSVSEEALGLLMAGVQTGPDRAAVA